MCVCSGVGGVRVGESSSLLVGYCSCGRCSQEDVKLSVEPDSFPHRNFFLKTTSLFPVSGSLTVTGVGMLGRGVVFMSNDVKWLRNVNDGKKRPFHIWQCALP